MLSRIARTSLRLSTVRPIRFFTQKTVVAENTENTTKNTVDNTDTTKHGRANEIIEAVLYGSKKIKEEERQTHSKVLARGKYVHELQGKLTFIICLR